MDRFRFPFLTKILFDEKNDIVSRFKEKRQKVSIIQVVSEKIYYDRKIYLLSRIHHINRAIVTRLLERSQKARELGYFAVRGKQKKALKSQLKSWIGK